MFSMKSIMGLTVQEYWVILHNTSACQKRLVRPARGSVQPHNARYGSKKNLIIYPECFHYGLQSCRDHVPKLRYHFVIV